MISRVYIDNYNSLVNFTMNLSSVNTLIGRNGSGKTSIFRALKSIVEFVSEHKSIDEVFSDRTLTRWIDSNVQTFEIHMICNERAYIYHLEVEYDIQANNKRVKCENVKCDGKSLFEESYGHVTLYNDSFAAGAEIVLDWNYSGVGMVAERKDNMLLSAFKRIMARVIICSPKPYLISGVVDNEKLLPDYDFSLMGNVIKRLLLESPEKIVKLNEEYKLIFPSFSRVYLSGEGEDKTVYFSYNIKDKEYPYKVTEISDGERQIYALYLLLMYYLKEGYLLFIDEPDNYVSLKEIQPWCILLEQILDDSKCHGQCTIISHHSEIIDYLAQDSGIWISRGGNYASRISEPPTIIANSSLRLSEYIKGMEDE